MSGITIDRALAEHRIPYSGWLAGFPRSGAALVRNILARCFGQTTTSKYMEATCGQAHANAVDAMEGEVSFADMAGCAERQGALFCKTHEHATQADGNRRTIVIVRDPRRVFGSLRAWYGDTGQGHFAMSDLIRGRHRWGSWSDWVRSWAVYAHSKDTLWLRYGELCADPIRNGAERIAERFGFKIIGREVDDFNKLREANPVLFRARVLSGNGGMTAEEERLCWELHGSVAAMLGYYPDGVE